jgi:hypothetical protein
MKTYLAFLFLPILVTVGFGARDTPSLDQPAVAADQAEAPTAGSILATQVSEIASASDLPRKAKEKRIAGAVRLAVIAATADLKDPAQAVSVAQDLAVAAAKGAPQFSEAIFDAVANISVIAGVDGALAQIKLAVLAAAKEASEPRTVVEFASTAPRPPANPEFGGNAGDVVVSRSH